MSVVSLPLLTTTERQLIAALARLRFATRPQLLYWASVKDLSSITRTTNKLASDGWLHVYAELKPRVYRLTQQARRIVSTAPLSRRFSSMPVIKQHCHKNSAEIRLRETLPGATFQTRKFCLTHGLNPSVSEYLVKIGDADFSLALIDDYYMHSTRIPHALARVHTPDSRFFTALQNNVVRRWTDVVSSVLVFSTDSVQAEKHHAYVTANNINATVEVIEPIWDVI